MGNNDNKQTNEVYDSYEHFDANPQVQQYEHNNSGLRNTIIICTIAIIITILTVFLITFKFGSASVVYEKVENKEYNDAYNYYEEVVRDKPLQKRYLKHYLRGYEDIIINDYDSHVVNIDDATNFVYILDDVGYTDIDFILEHFSYYSQKQHDTDTDNDTENNNDTDVNNSDNDTKNDEEDIDVSKPPKEDKAQTSDTKTNSNDDSWKDIYIDVINGLNKDNYDGYELVYIDNDDIPELVVKGASHVVPSNLYWIYDGDVYNTGISFMDFYYYEKENYFLYEEGFTGYGCDTVLCLDGKTAEEVEKGEFYSTVDDEWYKWNGEDVSKDEYETLKSSAFDKDYANIANNLKPLSDIYSDINSY